MSVLGQYFDQLIQEVAGLFGSRTRYNQPSSVSPASPATNFIGSLGGYKAPIHGSWASSGGFTYQPNATHPTGHMGVDMRAQAGTSVYPLAPGVISNVGTDPKGGNVVNVTHADGVKTYYAHLSTVQVQKGDKVDNNTVLGAVGNTGNASHTFPHLHFQVWKDGQIQDPARFFSVPVYTNMSSEEKIRGPWLSEQSKEQAQAFNMQQHVSERRVAFTHDVERLFKFANQFYVVANMTPASARSILGVSPSATDGEINKAYKRVARQYHPDINKDPETSGKLVELNIARDTLLFPERQGLPSNPVRQNEEIQKDVDEWLVEIKRQEYREKIERDKKHQTEQKKKNLGVL